MLQGKPALQDIIDLDSESLRLAVPVPEMEAVRGYVKLCFSTLARLGTCM